MQHIKSACSQRDLHVMWVSPKLRLLKSYDRKGFKPLSGLHLKKMLLKSLKALKRFKLQVHMCLRFSYVSINVKAVHLNSKLKSYKPSSSIKWSASVPKANETWKAYIFNNVCLHILRWILQIRLTRNKLEETNVSGEITQQTLSFW